MAARGLRIALACAALVLAPGCGRDDESTGEPPGAPVPTVPKSDPPRQSESEPDATADPVPVEPAPEPEPDVPEAPPEPGGAVAPAEPEPPADSPTNDTPPPPGSDAESFEKFCDSNPGACG